MLRTLVLGAALVLAVMKSDPPQIIAGQIERLKD